MSYKPHDFKRLPFLTKVEDRIMNGHFDVTDAAHRLKGVVDGSEEVRLVDYLVYRPLPKALTDLAIVPNVHEQSYDMQLYYEKITEAIVDGVTVGGEYYNPMFMMWILLFQFEIPLYDKKGNLLEGSEINRPVYCTIDRYIFDLFWKAFKSRKYIGFIAGRGIGKSFITDCVMSWFYVLFNNQELIISATSEPIVEEAWSKFVDTIDLIEDNYPGYRQKRLVDSVKNLVAGEEYYDANNNKKTRGSKNSVRRFVYADNPNSTRGRRPHVQHIEEFAAFPAHPSKGSLKNCIGQSKGSWKVMGSVLKAFVIMTGTGGSVNNKDAEDVFTNPDGFNLLKITEWGKDTGVFIPTYLKFAQTWERYGVPDINLAMLRVLEGRKVLESDPIAYMQELQEFPISLEEVFTVRGHNIFNQDKIAEQLAKLKTASTKPWKTGKLEYVIDSEGQITGVVFRQCADGTIVILEEPETSADGIKNKLYVGGVDSIDQGNNDSLVEGSKLACAIKKRISGDMFSTTSNIYVAFYNERSDDVRWDYENILKLSMYYNAKLNVEYTKINIVSFFRQKGQLWRLLQRPSIAIGANISGLKASQLIGTPATASVIAHQDQKLADYIDDYYYQIGYIPVLEQLKTYDAKNRTKFDFVVAMGLAELADEDQLGKPADHAGSASKDLEDFGFYRDANGRKRWGTVPKKQQREIRSIAEEEATRKDNAPFKWVEATSSIE